MDYVYAIFFLNQILTTLFVDAYYGALHASPQDWVLICIFNFDSEFYSACKLYSHVFRCLVKCSCPHFLSQPTKSNSPVKMASYDV